MNIVFDIIKSIIVAVIVAAISQLIPQNLFLLISFITVCVLSSLLILIIGLRPKRKEFYYSKENNTVSVGKRDKEFQINVSGASGQQIYLYNSAKNGKGNCDPLYKIGKIGKEDKCKKLNLRDADGTSRVNSICLGGYFSAENPNGYYILGKIISLKHYGGENYAGEVVFKYKIRHRFTFRPI